MRQITVHGTVNADGVLTAQLPADIPPGARQIVVLFDDILATGWPPTYFEATFGSIPDLERPIQGIFEQQY